MPAFALLDWNHSRPAGKRNRSATTVCNRQSALGVKGGNHACTLSFRGPAQPPFNLLLRLQPILLSDVDCAADPIDDNTTQSLARNIKPATSRLPIFAWERKKAGMARDRRRHNHGIFINVNNHYEGSAPRTIAKIVALFTAPIL